MVRGDRGAPAAKPAQAWRQLLVIMVKAPEAGRVKTRLAAGVGVVAATSFYRHASSTLVARLGCDRRWQTVLAVAPDRAKMHRFWPRELGRVGQGSGNLGARMQRLFDTGRPGPIVIIGSDCTDLTRADIAEAFARLGAADVVIGPADDGGYWLVGARRQPRVPAPFENVRWSSATTLDDTLANLATSRVGMLRQLCDVDEPRDLERVAARYSRRVMPTSL